MSSDGGDFQLDTLAESSTLENEATGDNDADFSFLPSEKSPCHNFRLDTTAGFGMCKCGHPKSSHAAKQENKAAMLLTKLKAKNNSGDGDDELNNGGEKPCQKFRLDTTAAEFGVCKCGFKRAEHSVRSENKAKKALERLKESNLDKYQDYLANVEANDQACGNYRVDTAAAEFGTCVCGFKKEDHVAKDENVAAKLLKNLKEKNQKNNERADLAAQGVVQELTIPEETIPTETEVEQLTKAEQIATEPLKKKGKKKKGLCVIS